MPISYTGEDDVGSQFNSDSLDVGEEIFPRGLISAPTVSTGNQSLRLAFFTARRSMTYSQVRVISGGTAAAATPTLVRFGLYRIVPDGAATITPIGTLVAATPNDTALLAAASTAYTKAFATPVDVMAGQRYALGLLVVTGVAAPTMCGQTTSSNSSEWALSPRLAALFTGRSDLPASFTPADLSATGSRAYGVLLP